MSLLWVDGFESYGTSNGSAPSPTGVLGRQYTVLLESAIDIEEGRFGSGHSLQFGLGICNIKTPALTTNDTLIVGFAFKITTSVEVELVTLFDDSTEGVGVRIEKDLVSVLRGATVLGTGTFDIKQDAWYWLELKVKCNDTTGTYEVKIGESTVLSGSGVDTKEGTHDYHNIVRIADGYSEDFHIDDLYICDSSGASNNDFLGNVKVQTLLPDGAGNSTQFTPSAGSNYACVDEAIINDDTDYVEDSVSTNKDLYTFSNVASGTSGIKGVQIDTCCRETDATSYSIITVIRSGATDYDDSAQAIGTTNYVSKRRVAEQNPNTSAAWTETNINSAEFGIKVN